MLSTLLLAVPILAVATSVFVYRLNGRREILQFDVVQFYYAFVIAPLLFVWGKSFLFFLLREEVNLSLSQNELFFWDTLFSLLSIYIFGFVMMHSLTKSFSLRVKQDPLYDIFRISEYFHLWVTHIVMLVGGLLLVSIVSLFNAYFELPILPGYPRVYFYLLLAGGYAMGILTFLGIWLSDPKQHRRSFMRFMKLCNGAFFTIHVTIYFIWTPPFDLAHGFYWASLMLFSASTSFSFFTYKSKRFKKKFDLFSNKLKHPGWNFRLQVFNDRKNVAKK